MIKSRLNKFALGLLLVITLIFMTFDFLLILQKNTELQIFNNNDLILKRIIFIFSICQYLESLFP